MEFCPKCGTKLVAGAVFCQHCGYKIENDSDSTTTEIEQTTSETKEPKENLNKKYAVELSRDRNKDICAVDGGEIGLLNKSIELSDGYYVCGKHFKEVFLGKTKKGDNLPTLVEFLEMLNDPSHVADYLPEEKQRKADFQAKLDKYEEDSKKAKQEKADRKAYKNAVKCPKCGSTDVVFMQNNKKAFSTGKAIGGAVLTGGIGALAGFTGKKGKNEWHCNNCGNTFKTKK
ncbi:hypothetical protein FC84_GL001627 [Lapidilactobacillus dextrinicus DSM 20335]|uniref:Zinc-ribbon domain-containing protein n=1 Tax=Lapidilactobacillus dextrinicus DSM 20335 TaxID=1423738 RepID=A0A0R2BIT0_9LACO|nr:zinc-ribbon domain-containing protein [Lapidilactobacillus dextrinicus]KRM79448.1 hypothetical protein FC84_GL001627 [Lapidilactobacillus dextrinicus DSM 20335]QFG46717.1 zinc-ribbon domain-containing protein [Lapidilactobacillus dextrinicus]